MKINADFSRRVLVHTEQMDWISSPMPGVSRRPLDRVGDEVARATTIVRYEPGSHFSPHVHTGGEEFIVLDGVFQDEHGDFPAGSYIRNPPQSSHAPGSESGCVIFVKLWQFEPEDRTHVRLNTEFMASVPHKDYKAVSVTPLYRDAHEEVALYVFKANACLDMSLPLGAELLVLEGDLEESGDKLLKHSWLRLPEGSRAAIVAGSRGVKVWIKKNHLGSVSRQIERVEKMAKQGS